MERAGQAVLLGVQRPFRGATRLFAVWRLRPLHQRGRKMVSAAVRKKSGGQADNLADEHRRLWLPEFSIHATANLRPQRRIQVLGTMRGLAASSPDDHVSLTRAVEECAHSRRFPRPGSCAGARVPEPWVAGDGNRTRSLRDKIA